MALTGAHLELLDLVVEALVRAALAADANDDTAEECASMDTHASQEEPRTSAYWAHELRVEADQ